MIKLTPTRTFTDWLNNLRDERAVARIEIRLRRLSLGNSGQSRAVGGGVVELKIDYGPGYRVYFIRRGTEIIVLLCGGDKSTQSKDIALAKTLAATWEKENPDAS